MAEKSRKMSFFLKTNLILRRSINVYCVPTRHPQIKAKPLKHYSGGALRRVYNNDANLELTLEKHF